MSLPNNERIQTVKHWLLLKQSWGQWQAGGTMSPLPAETQRYFESLSWSFMLAAFEKLGAAFDRVPRPESPREAWAIMLRHLAENRKLAKNHVLDDIFDRARAKAEEHYGEAISDEKLDHFIGWVINQFEMRVRDAVRVLARELGTPGQISATTSGDASLDASRSGDGADQGRSLFDVLQVDSGDWGTDVEREEIETLGEARARSFFPGVRPAYKLSLFRTGLRERRLVTISCADPTILSVAGVKTAVFAEGANSSRLALAQRLAQEPAWHELDPSARAHMVVCSDRLFMDLIESWFSEATWVIELWEIRKADLKPDAYYARAVALAELVLERLKEEDALLSENEMSLVFNELRQFASAHGLARSAPTTLPHCHP